MFVEQGPCQSFPSVHNVSKVYHPMIRLINGTAAEQTTWLKCKYPKCKWLNWIIGNYRVSSRDLLDAANGSRGVVNIRLGCSLLRGGEEREGKKKMKAGMQAGNNVSAVTGSCHRWQKSESTPRGQACTGEGKGGGVQCNLQRALYALTHTLISRRCVCADESNINRRCSEKGWYRVTPPCVAQFPFSAPWKASSGALI